MLNRLVLLGPEQVSIFDLIESLRMISKESVPLEALLSIHSKKTSDDVEELEKLLKDGYITHSESSTSDEPFNPHPFFQLCCDVLSHPSKLRAKEMIAVGTDLVLIHKRIPLSSHVSLKPLLLLMQIFCERMTYLIALGVLSLTHADIMLELCETLQIPEDDNHVFNLKEARREANKDEDNVYYTQVDIDVRDIFFKTQIINNLTTYQSFKPIPSSIFIEYRTLLEEQRADYILEAIHLYNQAYPDSLKTALRRNLSNAIIGKFSPDKMEYVVEKGQRVTKPVRPIPFTITSLTKLINLIDASPLKKMKKSPITWAFLERASERLQHPPLNKLIERKKAMHVQEESHSKIVDKNVYNIDGFPVRADLSLIKNMIEEESKTHAPYDINYEDTNSSNEHS